MAPDAQVIIGRIDSTLPRRMKLDTFLFASEIDRLYKNLTGVAQLCPIERHLELKLSGDGKGHVLVEGKAQHRLSLGTYLAFRLEIDQTELPAIVSCLRSADPDHKHPQ